MAEYRRAATQGDKRGPWHFNEACLQYPWRTYIIAEAGVPEAEICPECQTRAHRDGP